MTSMAGAYHSKPVAEEWLGLTKTASHNYQVYEE